MVLCLANVSKRLAVVVAIARLSGSFFRLCVGSGQGTGQLFTGSCSQRVYTTRAAETV